MDSGITVTGTGQAQAPADLLRLQLSIGRSASDVSDAVDAVAGKTEAAKAALIGQGVAAADIRTSSVNVFPEYGDGMRVTGYRASHTLSVSTADLTGFGRLLKAVVAAVGNDLGLDQLSFDIDDKTALVEQARHSAFADARDRARHLADLAGRELGVIDSVIESRNHGGYEPMDFAVPLKGRAAGSPEIAVSPGQQTVEASVTVRWSWQ
ncbi:SIMPL domain-containing protein [Kribbella sp. NBC_01245]|uniref:SIMPL domain-containing protein n=1 Tax=Kribbella sp. NBC_01245 TaxID=2903578 RepID=UPI002E2CA409|nr:SIMPL domain-containing protein [Kribbella sp. NBC_01245]